MEYAVRMPTIPEWRHLMEQTAMDRELHWNDLSFWAEHNTGHEAYALGQYSPYNLKGYNPDWRATTLGFRPVFVPLFEDGNPDGTRIAAATLCMDHLPVPISTKPSTETDEPAQYIPNAELEFIEPLNDPNFQIQAVKADGVYIADRCVLVSASWKDLASQGFGPALKNAQAKMPTFAEYLAAMQKEPDMHWENMFSWLSDEPGARCGYLSADFLGETDQATRDARIGFRPVFEADKELWGETPAVATLFLDGVPVAVPNHPTHNGDIPEYKPGMKIEFREPLLNAKYQICGVSIGGKYVADRCVLRNVSWDDLAAQGF